MPNAVRLLPLKSAGGAANMAADEVMLRAAADGEASLRCYTWSEPTLSLGYFQLSADARFAAIPWLRRASGGAALVHDRELTYALALPASWQRRGESWVCRMHRVIAQVLIAAGVTAEGSVCGAEKKLGPVLCFLHHTPGDLILDGHKIVGSAQRKQRGAVLQHGGILLAQSNHAPMLPGIRELTGVELQPAELAETIQREWERETGWRLTPAEWTDAERGQIEELIATKYSSSSWNGKR